LVKVYFLDCRAFGMNCEFSAHASTVEEVIERCAEHGRTSHGMLAFEPEFYARMRSAIRLVEEDEPARPA
jgi:predicted small metal-binding protein